mgnify:FL=1
MTNNNNNGMQDREIGGIEYAIVRNADGAMLEDREGDGTDVLWTTDGDNAIWYDTEDMALAGANTNGLTNDDGGNRLIDGYHLISRPWYYDDDLVDDATEE